MVEQSAAFHRIKYIKSYDNMAQIILLSKINGMDTSNEIQNHPFYLWGQLLSSLFEKPLVAVCETYETGSARGWKREAKRRRAQHEMGGGAATFPFFHYAFLRFSFRVIH